MGYLLIADRAILCLKQLSRLNSHWVRFVLCTEVNTPVSVCGHSPTLDQAGQMADQKLRLMTPLSFDGYPVPFRRLMSRYPESSKELEFLTNRSGLAVTKIVSLYKHRWQIELFFKWLKQNLAVKHFFGYSINGVKSQIWCTSVSIWFKILLCNVKLNKIKINECFIKLFWCENPMPNFCAIESKESFVHPQTMQSKM